jgi:hypothetical protein
MVVPGKVGWRMVGGGGVEKMAELRWPGRASTSPAAGGDDGGGEA